MNIKRDKFLTEMMGECWHDWKEEPNTESWDERNACKCADFRCVKCGAYESEVAYQDTSGWAHPRNDDGYILPVANDFSTPDGFFKLWNWTQKQEWFYLFEKQHTEEEVKPYIALSTYYIHPDRFADAVYNYLRR